MKPHPFSLFATLIAFSMTTVPSAYAFEPVQMQGGLNDLAFGMKIEKLIEKIKRYKTKLEPEKMLGVMGELKTDVEGYIGKKIDLDQELDRIESEMKKGGAKLKKGEFEKIRNLVKQAEEQHDHKLSYMFDCLTQDIAYDTTTYGIDKEDIEAIKVPVKVTLGVAMALCGFLLTYVPISFCQTNGSWISKAGIDLAVDGTSKREQ